MQPEKQARSRRTARHTKEYRSLCKSVKKTRHIWLHDPDALHFRVDDDKLFQQALREICLLSLGNL